MFTLGGSVVQTFPNFKGENFHFPRNLQIIEKFWTESDLTF